MLPGIRTVFRSRWHALFWAAGIIWLAYDVAGSAPNPHPDANASAADKQAADDTKAAERILAGKF